MPRFSVQIDVARSTAMVWNVLADLVHWPTWTPTMRKVTIESAGPPDVGTRVRIEQPQLRPATWTIDTWTPEQGFSWNMSNPGMRARADHQITPRPQGSRVSLSVDFSGPIGHFVAFLLKKRIQSYLEQEAQGLKRHCELAP